ncbi:LOW QUALITY PROTEIN: ACT domain-containing protein ACR1-like [Actinidia eriantha]|uniref:LOW QUALITY PROTEIN: ACT domain-containing protein ACR1-like n=1 Tax=Actinidia eriantha TaxID=165200 RepID=UPI002584367F|nr:LOW QUALITY PROTEIN: ACT domain-containing protein ACR1-like [Actinidia eriantha]
MEIVRMPYFDAEFEKLIERIYPPKVCIDNNTCQDCTLVKVDSKNRQGILLEMVQVLTDLDLVISKSYICSDGFWFMDVFHVTDQLGNKITDERLILYIQEVMCASRRAKDVETRFEGEVRPLHVSTKHTAFEITGTDQPGLLSEISAVLNELGCHVAAAVAWTHKARVACIIYVEDKCKGGPITDLNTAAQVQAQLENVVEAHHREGERRSVRLAAPAASQTHTERRLHQMMSADRDYEVCCTSTSGGTQVTIDHCKERGYAVVNVRSRDRPKLLFDTVCALTDMQYVVFHASVSSEGSIANQEYYIRDMSGCTLDSESERRRVAQCLTAAIERRVSHGLRLDICMRNRRGLLSEVTRAFRENGLSVSRAEIGTRYEKAIGSFYVTDSSGQDVNLETVEMVRKEIGGPVLVVGKSLGQTSETSTSSTSRSESSDVEDRPRFSLGTLLWSQLERLSVNFRPIKS